MSCVHRCSHCRFFASTLDKRKDDRIDRAKRLSARLKEYEEILDLKERKETLTHLMKYQEHMKKYYEAIAVSDRSARLSDAEA